MLPICDTGWLESQGAASCLKPAKVAAIADGCGSAHRLIWTFCHSAAAAFARRRRLRIEIYIDYGDRQRNKACFDLLYSQKEHLEQVVGEPLAWERLDQKRACRIAAYTQAQVSTQSENEMLIEWAARRALEMYGAFSPYFSEGSF